MGDRFHPEETGMDHPGTSSKGKFGYLGVVPIKVVWKVVEAMMDTWIKTVVQFHDVLHRFRSGRGSGNAIMYLKLAQELESVDQDPILLLFLDLRKLHDNLYKGRLLQTLEGHAAVPKLRVLLAEFWLRQELVTHQNGFHVPQFQSNRGST